MQFVDKALARRLEACEEMPQVYYAREFQKSRPAIGAAEEEICGGHMIFAGLGSPIGRATGAGLDRPFTAEDLDRVEQFYREHGAPSQVDLCPLHEAAVFEMFKERGYGIAELNNVLYRRLDRDEKFAAAPAGCEIRRGLARGGGDTVGDRGAGVLSRWRTRGFHGPAHAALPDEGRCDVRGQCRRQDSGLRGGARHSRAPDIRGVRGRHAGGVSRTRVADGAVARTPGGRAEAGCEYAVVVTQGGTVSQRNCERLGFRVAYSKVTVIKNLVQLSSRGIG